LSERKLDQDCGYWCLHIDRWTAVDSSRNSEWNLGWFLLLSDVHGEDTLQSLWR